LKKLLLTLLKIGVSAAIIGWLIRDAHRNEAFGKLVSQPKDWGLLTLAALSCGSAVVVTLVRWYYLVRALDLPFTLKEALRLGFLGYLFNLAPMGIVGGDLLKAVMLARQQHGHRAEVVATVFVDRVMGLYMLFIVASVAILLTGFYNHPNDKIRLTCLVTLGLTVVGALGIAAMLVPDMTGGRLPAQIGRIPYAGHFIVRLLDAVGMYRHRLGVLAVTSVMSIMVHSLYSLGMYLLTRALFDPFHSLGTQFVLAPLAALTGVIPLPAGPFEAVLDRLYSSVPLANGLYMTVGQGLIVALGYRIITVGTAAIGVVYYLAGRQELAAAMHDVEEGVELPEEAATA
jgi:hypothetical protein